MRLHASRKHSTRWLPLRGRRPSTQYLEALETRVLLSIAFTSADVGGFWHDAGTSVEGALQFNGLGQIITGSLLHADGSTTGASGTYAINSDGTLSVVTPSSAKTGGMSNTRDVITLTDNSTNQALSVLVTGGSTTFSDASLSGTWNFGMDGDTTQTSGFGTVSFDGAGAVTGGTVTNSLGTGTITGGSYAVDSGGRATLYLTTLDPDSSVGSVTLTGALNASGDMLAMNPPDLQEAIAEPGSRLVVLVKSSGSYSDADGAGTWLLSADGRTGYITLDGGGNVTGGIIHHSDGSTTIPSGSYTISSTGALTVLGGNTSFTGAMNAAHNAIVMSSTDADNLNILLATSTPVNHAPTLSAIRQLGPASAGVPLTMTYAQLAAASNASDVDGDPIQFQISALGSGALTLNGNAVTSAPVLVSAGDTLTWTAPAAASGALTAFSVQAFDGTLASGTDVPVVVGTGPDSAGAVSGNWTVAGTSVGGTIQFDSAGGIIGGSLTDNTGATITPSGNYIIAPRGTVDVTLGTASQFGVLNATQDVMTIVDKHQGNSLALLVRGNGAVFSNADLTGSWTVEINGNSPDSNGVATLTFDGAGHITAGSFVGGGGLQTGVSGDYTINADGTCTVNIITPSGNGSTHTLTFVGALDGSKDILAASNANLQAAASNNDGNLVVLVRSSGAYSLADAAGTWLLATGGGSGSVMVDGAGHITSGFFKDTQGDSLALSGNVTVTSSGVFTATVQGSSNGAMQHLVITGIMNAARNMVATNQVSTLQGSNLSILTKIADHAPTLTAINPLGTASAGKPFTFTYNDLKNAANLADADGDTLTFIITSTGAGTLTVNDAEVTTLPVSIKSGDTVVWTPPAGASGAVTAFTVRAFDGIVMSATPVAVTINTVPFSGSSVSGAWTFAGSSAEGSLELDNAGFITTGSLTQTNGVVQTPTGIYAVNSDGTLVLNTNFGVQSGALNATRDLIAIANNTLDNTLSVLVNPGGSDFSNTDLSGNWTLEYNGPTPDSNGNGTITFDGTGGITGGSLVSGTGTQTVTGGSYTVNGDGTCNVTITTGSGNVSYVGALNSAKDLAALNPPDLQAAAGSNASNLLVMVRSSGVYTLADAAGTWSMFTEGGHGTFTVDATGHLTSGTFTSWDGTASTLGGSVNVAANGQLTLNGTLTTNGSAQAVTAAGIINASRNAIVQNTVGTSSNGALAVMIESTNHAPTLTTVGPLGPMTAGKPVTITYDTLLAASNAADADHDPIQFQITALGSGQLMLDGAAVTTFPATVSAGDVLVWSPPSSATGNLAAFSVVAFDGVEASATPVSVAVNMAVFTNNDIGGNWVFAGTGADGCITFDSGGNIVDGSLNFSDGSTGETPTGTYTLQSPSGAVTLGLSTGGPAVNAAGGINRTRDVITAVDSSNGGTLSVLVSPGNASFTNADISGTWFLAFNGDSPSSNGLGTINFDGAGHITGGTINNGATTKSIVGGDYTVNSDGTFVMHVSAPGDSGGAPHTSMFSGSLNASKDVLALNPPDLQSAVNGSSSDLTLGIHASGAYTTADAAGTWTIAGDGELGSVTFDAGGHVTSGTINTHHGALTLSGSCTVAANGKFTFNAISSGSNGTQALTFTGSLNAARNTIIMNHVENGTRNGADNLTVLTNAGNHAPTLTTVQTLATALSGKPFAITYDALEAASNENDIDGDPIQFIITAGGTGSLALDGNAVSSFPITVSAGDTITWTPPATGSGTITAFSIKASDGIASSSVAVPVRVTTALQAATSIAATKQASEINAATTGKGLFTITRANGNLTAPLTVNFAVSGNAALTSDYALTSTAALSVDASAQTGSVTIPAGQTAVTISVAPVADTIAEGPQAVILTLTASSDYNVAALKGQASITIADSASTLSVAATKPAASEIAGATSGAGIYTFTRAGGDLSGPLTVEFSIGGTALAGTNYTVATAGGTVTFDNGSSTGTVTFAAGKPTATVTINPLNDGVANTPALTAVLTIQADAGPSYLINSAKNAATVKIADAASTLAVAASKPAASEIAGATSGAGVYTLTRSGGNLTLPLTVDFAIGGTAAAGTNYTVASSGGAVSFDNGSGNGTVTFAAGKTTASVTINPLNDGVANTPALTAVLTIQADANPGSYFINSSGGKNTATVKIADAASTISVAATKPAASEISGTTTGAGIYTVTRTGGDLSIPLTINFALTGNATAGVDYNVVTSGSFSSGNGTGTVVFGAGKSTATVTIAPIDDVVTDPGEQVILTLAADGGPSYFINQAKAQGTVTIADDTRAIFFANASPVMLLGATHGQPFTITYATLVAQTGVLDHNPLATITFKITGKLSGTLTKNGTPIVPGTTTVGTGESLVWTPATAGTLSALTLVATDGTSTTPTAMTIKVAVT